MSFYEFKQTEVLTPEFARRVASSCNLPAFSDIMRDGACLGFIHYGMQRLSRLILEKRAIDLVRDIPQILIREISTPLPSSILLEQFRVIFRSMLFQEQIIRQSVEIPEVGTTSIKMNLMLSPQNALLINLLSHDGRSYLRRKYSLDPSDFTAVRKFIFTDEFPMKTFGWNYLYSAITYAGPSSRLTYIWVKHTIVEYIYEIIRLAQGADYRRIFCFNLIIEGELRGTPKFHIIGFHVSLERGRRSILFHVFDPNYGILQEYVPFLGVINFLKKVSDFIAGKYSNFTYKLSLVNIYEYNKDPLLLSLRSRLLIKR